MQTFKASGWAKWQQAPITIEKYMSAIWKKKKQLRPHFTHKKVLGRCQCRQSRAGDLGSNMTERKVADEVFSTKNHFLIGGSNSLGSPG